MKSQIRFTREFREALHSGLERISGMGLGPFEQAAAQTATQSVVKLFHKLGHPIIELGAPNADTEKMPKIRWNVRLHPYLSNEFATITGKRLSKGVDYQAESDIVSELNDAITRTVEMRRKVLVVVDWEDPET